MPRWTFSTGWLASATAALLTIGLSLADAGDGLPKGALLRLGSNSSAKGDSNITCVAVSPDGKLIATSHADGHVRVWDAKGKLVHQLQHGAGAVLAVTFAPDGKTLALGHEREGITIWDARSGMLKRHIKSEHSIYSLAFAPDGKFLASESSHPEHVQLWDAADGNAVKKFERYNPYSRCVAVSPNGRFLASTGKHALHVWDLHDGRLVIGKQNYEVSAAFSPGGILLALAGDHFISIVEMSGGKKIAEFRSDGDAKALHAVAFSPDGRHLAAAHGAQVRLWDIGARSELASFPGHQRRVTAVAFLPDGKTLVSGSEDGSAFLWDLCKLEGEKQAAAKSQLEALGDRDFLRAYAAFCRLRAVPAEAQALLQQHLGPATRLPADGFKRLLENLDSPNFDVRNRAIDEARGYGVAVEKALRKARAGNLRLETIRRVDDLLKAIDTEWPRALWCVRLLEDLATPQARELLEALSRGDPESRLTRAGAAALEHLPRRKEQ